MDSRDELPGSELAAGTVSTAGGTVQMWENAFGREPELIEDSEQVFDSYSATVDRVARNMETPSTERQGFRIRRFLANLMK